MSLQTNIHYLAKRMIKRILSEGHLCGFSDDEIEEILIHSETILKNEPATLFLPAPIVVFGDIHGQLPDLLKFFSIVGTPPDRSFLFLGDYVDRSKKSLEVIVLLLCYKILHPTLVLLLRGNHECSQINRVYGFFEELSRKRSVNLWKQFNDVFNHFPLCAIISDKIICMHGGISPHIRKYQDLIYLKKPSVPLEYDKGVAADLMWSDPASDTCCRNYQFNLNRQISVVFGKAAVQRFCSKLGFQLIVRAHEMVEEGHLWQFDKHLLTLFSAPNYCGTDGNCGSILKISKNLDLSFITLKPMIDEETVTMSEQEKLRKIKNVIEAKTPDPYALKKEMLTTNCKKI